MARPKKYRNEEERKQARREAARVRRELRKQDPLLKEYDKETERRRYRKRVRDGKIKLVSDMSNREKRQKRKMWRLNTKKYRFKKALLDAMETPPTTPSVSDMSLSRGNSSSRSGRKRKARKEKAKAYRDNDKLRAINVKLKKQVDNYRKRYERLKEKTKLGTGTQILTPRTRATKTLATNDANQVRRKVIFGEVLKDQLTKNYKNLRSVSSKQIFTKLLGGDLLKKYRVLKEAGEFLTYKACRLNGKRNALLLRYERNHRIDALKMRKTVKTFLEMDENSMTCPGKKDVVRSNRVVRQKRFLTDTLRNLHAKFLKTYNIKMCYASFCKFRPFYIVSPKAKDRETCLCTVHENMRLILQSLNDHRVITFSNPGSLVAAVCCNNEEENCLNRFCNLCKDGNIPTLPYDDKCKVKYFQRVRTTELVTTKNSSNKAIKVMIKKEMECSLRNLVEKANGKLQSFLCHINNIRHQHHIFRSLRKPQSEENLCIHIDFSENYLCKYRREPQSVHFGGSKKQLTLHTGVAYWEQIKISFSTVSEELRHDARAVIAHLYPILTELLERFKSVTRINFISDGPSSQYKNRTLFSAIGTIIPTLFPTIEELTWNYSESGHGKGAPDGIGGTLKRTADRIVAHGLNDIFDVTSFLNRLKLAAPRILLKHVAFNDIREMDSKFTKVNTIDTVRGSSRAHQVTWSRNKNELHFNSLSCLKCKPGHECLHYGFKCVPLHPLPIENAISSDDDHPANLPVNDIPASLTEDDIIPSSNHQNDNVAEPSQETVIRVEPSSSSKTQPLFTHGIGEEGDWIGVAYKNNWYPDIVKGFNGNELKESYNDDQPATLPNYIAASFREDNTSVPSQETVIHVEPSSSSKAQPIFTHGLCEEGDWIVVAYEDDWYPGIVEGVNGEELKVSYMAKSTQPSRNNYFYWPLIADRHTVSSKDILYKMSSPPTQVCTKYMALEEFKYIKYLYESSKTFI